MESENESLMKSSDTGRATSESSSAFLVTKYPTRLSWHNLEYKIESSAQATSVLKSVSGYADSGEILAIMGESGSGKTSLLSILSGRLNYQSNIEISGEVYVNKLKIKELEYPLMSSYLSQDNIYFSYMTPRESLIFAASLKLSIPSHSIKKRVNKLLKLLQIENVADTIMGDSIYRGLSGGEKRRVCIATELISNPSILMLDEPISGLDSFNAKIVINILRNMANKGKTIILTVHQPGDFLFSTFDRIIFMQEGRFAYQGPRYDCTRYFSAIGLDCPKHSNPGEYYIKLFHIENRHSINESEKKLMKLVHKTYVRSHSTLDTIDYKDLNIHKSLFRVSRSFWAQVYYLTKRGFKGYLRNPFALLFKIANTVVFGTLVALLYWNLDVDFTGVMNRSGLLECGVFNSLFFPILVGAFVLPMERALIHKEYKDRLYGIEAYLVSKLLVELPMNIFFAVGLNTIVYYSADLNTTESDKFFIAIAILFICQVSGVVLGIISGGLSNDVTMASFLGPTFSVPFIMFSGFFSKTDSIPTVFSWIKYISPFYYGYQAMLNNEFDGLDVENDVYPDPYTLFEIRKNIGTYFKYFLINIAVGLVIGYIIIKKRADRTAL